MLSLIKSRQSSPIHSNASPLLCSFSHFLFSFFRFSFVFFFPQQKEQHKTKSKNHRQAWQLPFYRTKERYMGFASGMAGVRVNAVSWYHLRLKNRKSGWLTWSSLNQLSVASKRVLANWRADPPFRVHKDPLNLYEARPKTGKEILGTPSVSHGRVITGASAFCIPESNQHGVTTGFKKQTDLLVVTQISIRKAEW